MSLKVANTIVITDDLRGRFANTTFTGGAYLVMPEDPSVEYQFQGTISGYAAAGLARQVPTFSNVIDKFLFSSDGNATDVGDLTSGKYDIAGQTSKSNGYVSNGVLSPGSKTNVIEKFPFAVDTNATDIADLTQARRSGSGQSSQINGYTSGGEGPPLVNTIDRFPFSADNNAVDVGDMTQARTGMSGNSSKTSGYNSGGFAPPVRVSTIESFPFSSDTNSGLVGDLVRDLNQMGSSSSETHGYVSGGLNPPLSPTHRDEIQKFSFASDGNASDVGNLVEDSQGQGGSSSVTSGYFLGGTNPVTSSQDTIQKFLFASDGNTSDTGNLTQSRDQGISNGNIQR